MTRTHDDVGKALKLIFDGIELLQGTNNHGRKFTIDGRLVGDIGELIAAREYEIELDSVMRARHDAKTLDGRDVQIKATFKDSLTFTSVPDLYLGLKLFRDGGHEVIFNGPGRIIAQTYGARQGFGVKQLSFPIRKLKELSMTVSIFERVPMRAGI